MAARISASCSSAMPFAATVCAAASLECAAVGEFLSLAAPDVTGSAVAVVALEFSGTIAIGSASGVTDAGADCGGTRAGAAVRFVAGRTENEIVAAPAAAALPISFLGDQAGGAGVVADVRW